MDKGKKSKSKKSGQVPRKSAGVRKGEDYTDMYQSAHLNMLKDVRDGCKVPDSSTSTDVKVVTEDVAAEDNQVLGNVEEQQREIRRLMMELSALRRQEADSKNLLQILMAANNDQTTTAGGEVNLNEIVESCIQQRDELRNLALLVERLSSLVRTLMSAKDTGRCLKCAARNCREDITTDVPITDAVQCSEQSTEDSNESRQILLNDGRQFTMYSSSSDDSGLSSVKSPVPHRSQDAADGQDHEDDTLQNEGAAAAAIGLISELQLCDERPFIASADNAMLHDLVEPCPICQKDGFLTVEQLNIHVNSEHFIDVTD